MKLKILIFLILIISITIPVSAKDTSKSSIVMDLESGRVLYENNSNEKKLIASTTKIMTAILSIENLNLNKKLIATEEILKMYGTSIYLELNEQMTVKDLLYGLLLRSGNDAAVVLANNVAESEEVFVELMNKKAKEIGMKNSKFSNCHGLDDETKNYSTAYDMALLSKYVYQNKTYREISNTKKYRAKTENKSYLWYNRNKLLSNYKYCTGGKNGYTPKAGRTLVTTASKDNLELTIVTLNDSNEYETHEYLYNKIFEKYKKYTIINKENFRISKEWYDGNLYIKESFSYPLTNDEIDKIITEISIDKITRKNSKVGRITIKLDNQIIGNIDIYNQQKEKEDETIFNKIKNYLTATLKKLKPGLQNNLKPGPLVPKPLEIYKSEVLTS